LAFLAETAAMAAKLFNDEAYLDFIYKIGGTGEEVDARPRKTILSKLKHLLAGHGFDIPTFGDDDFAATPSQLYGLRQPC